MIKTILKAVTDPSPVPNWQDGDLPSRRARVQERIAILLPLDERPGVVTLCLKGHYCVALEQEASNLAGRYTLAHNWQALEAEAQQEWQAEGDPYEEGACVRVFWSLERGHGGISPNRSWSNTDMSQSHPAFGAECAPGYKEDGHRGARYEDKRTCCEYAVRGGPGPGA